MTEEQARIANMENNVGSAEAAEWQEMTIGGGMDLLAIYGKPEFDALMEVLREHAARLGWL